MDPRDASASKNVNIYRFSGNPWDALYCSQKCNNNKESLRMSDYEYLDTRLMYFIGINDKVNQQLHGRL